MGKHWDYEDEHGWDDNIDYAARDEVYWYGKYLPREQVEAMYPPEINGRKVLGLVGGTLFAILTAVGVSKWRNRARD